MLSSEQRGFQVREDPKERATGKLKASAGFAPPPRSSGSPAGGAKDPHWVGSPEPRTVLGLPENGSPLLSLPLQAQASSLGVLNPPRLFALAGTSPCVRPHGTAGICVGITGPVSGALSSSGFLPHGIPHPPGRALPHGPLTARPHLPHGALNFSSLGGSPDQHPAVSLPPRR